MRRLYADREEKRVTRGNDTSGHDGEQEQLDLNDPNQRSLLEYTLLGDSTDDIEEARFRCRYAVALSQGLVDMARDLAAETAPSGTYAALLRTPGRDNPIYPTEMHRSGSSFSGPLPPSISPGITSCRFSASRLTLLALGSPRFGGAEFR
jgi:hypothetical protein